MCVPKGDSVEYVSMFSSGKCFRSLKLELILEMFCFFFSSLIVTISSYFHKKFLWKGKDKVTRKSAINDYEGGGIKMVDIESMIECLRLAWLERIFGDNSGAWKNYLEYLLKDTEFFLERF